MDIKKTVIDQIKEDMTKQIVSEGTKVINESPAPDKAGKKPAYDPATMTQDGTTRMEAEGSDKEAMNEAPAPDKAGKKPAYDPATMTQDGTTRMEGEEITEKKKGEVKDEKEGEKKLPDFLKKEGEEITEARDKENSKFDDKDCDDKDDMKMKESVDPINFDELFSSLNINLTEDEKVKLFEGIDLEESTKEQLVTLFQEAVAERCKTGMKKGMEKAYESYGKKLKENTEAIDTKATRYMEGVAKKWLHENQIALESSFRTRIAESFMEQLGELLEAHNFELSDEKIPVVEKLQEKIQRLEEKYAETKDEVFSLKEAALIKERESIFEESIENLTDVQADKIRSLIEGIKFESNEDFTSKLTQIKESVVAVKEKVITESETPESDPFAEFKAQQKAILEFAMKSKM